MDKSTRANIHTTFAVYAHIKLNGGFAYELRDDDPKKLRELIAVFISEAETVLKDIYGVDEEEKELDPDEYMNRKTNLSSPYGSAITEDIYFED